MTESGFVFGGANDRRKDISTVLNLVPILIPISGSLLLFIRVNTYLEPYVTFF